MIQLPLVSISCITFNHASYLRQCLDSFLMQKIDFLIEIVIRVIIPMTLSSLELYDSINQKTNY
jgi:hypothetical protein